MRKRTTKPCPGCGEVVPSRAADDVCWECAGYIKAGKAAAERDAAKSRLDDYNLPAKEWPHFSAHHHTTDACRELRKKLAVALVSLVPRSLRQGDYGGSSDMYLPSFGDGWQGPGYWMRVRMSPSAAEKVRALHVELSEALDKCYALGVSEGQNLLKQLALGSISAEKFDSVTEETRETMNGTYRRARRRRGVGY